MAEIEIRFRMNMDTGKKDIFIDFQGEEDAMRHEHERDHKRIIKEILGDMDDDEIGEIVVSREQPTVAVENPGPTQDNRQTQSEPG